MKHLSKIANVEQDFLYKIIYRYQEKDSYSVFRIRKHSGGYRFIHSPHPNLKRVQSFINKYILSKIEPHTSCFSYHKNGGILKCAQQHTQAKILFKYDLKDFFFCINEVKVFYLFNKLGYTPKLSFQMARLCTITKIKDYKRYIKKYSVNEQHIELGVLPQGAPTSPMLSNILTKPLDEKLTEISISENLVYTRYADDIIFSSYENLSSKKIMEINSKVKKAIQSEYFILNKKKVSICKQGARKIVLGLLVHDEKPKLSRQKRKKIDSFLYAIEKFGWESVSNYYGFLNSLGLSHHLHGLITYAQYIDEDLGSKYRKRFNQLLTKLLN